MSVVKPNNITREEASHESGQRRRPRTEKKVSVIGHKSPRIAGSLGSGAENRKSFNEVFTILIASEYVHALYSPNDDVV